MKIKHDHAIVHVQSKPCDKCLFSKNKIVSDKRKAEILADCKGNNHYFECHKATTAGVKGMCHAFYKAQSHPEINTMLEQCGLIKFVDIK